jgi:formate-dependent nitrite reductase membrane component NrfD
MTGGAPARPPAAGRAGRVTVPLLAAELQHEWDLYHATWFTLMGVGGGVFLVARLMGLADRLGLWLGLPVVDLVSFAVIGVGGLVLVWSLGRPLRVLRALARPGTSWISRGAIADFVFLAAGGALILPGLRLGRAAPFAWLPWDPWGAGAAGRVLEALALVSSAVVIVYAGLVLADKAAIPFWRSPVVPVQFTLSSLAMSMAAVMALAHASGEPIPTLACWLLFGFLALLLAAIVWHLTTETRAPGKAESLARLHSTFRRPFFGGVVAAGTVLPMALAAAAAAWPRGRGALGLVCLVATVAGGFGLRLITLRVGFFPPVTGGIRLRGR